MYDDVCVDSILIMYDDVCVDRLSMRRCHLALDQNKHFEENGDLVFFLSIPFPKCVAFSQLFILLFSLPNPW